MAFVICEPCVDVKSGDCIAACPTNAIHPKPSEPGYGSEVQLYIDPSACTDCGNCATVCSEQAIFSEFNVPSQWQSYIQKNADYYK